MRGTQRSVQGRELDGENKSQHSDGPITHYPLSDSSLSQVCLTKSHLISQQHLSPSRERTHSYAHSGKDAGGRREMWD